AADNGGVSLGQGQIGQARFATPKGAVAFLALVVGILLVLASAVAVRGPTHAGSVATGASPAGAGSRRGTRSGGSGGSGGSGLGATGLAGGASGQPSSGPTGTDGTVTGGQPATTAAPGGTTTSTNPPAGGLGGGPTTTTKLAVPPTLLPVTTSYPTTPPAPICDNRALLSGPVAPPAGSVRVDPADNLNDITQAHPAGTTFWLAPGTFRLGTGQYGQVIPKDNDVYLGAPGAILDGGGLNQYAFTQHARAVTIRFLTVQHFVSPRDQGVVNHDSGVAWVIQNNTFQNNKGASVMVGPNDLVSYNCLRNNGQYGFNAFEANGDANVTLDHNEIVGNNTDNWETQVDGCGCTGGGKFWNVAGAAVTNNWVHNNHGPGLWADTNNAGFDIEGNYIADNDGMGIIYEISYNARIANNTLLRNAIVQGHAAKPGDTFPIPAIYISESGGDARVFGGRYSTLMITGNYLKDNWGGVTLWENADRFCGSPANTSATFCTLGGSASFTTCVGGTITQAPYLSDCRWKTKNVTVSNNDFLVNLATIGCTTQGTCAQQAVLSQVGTSPSWSPYMGDKVQQAITFGQNNHFSGNRYHGSWRFTGFETGRTLALGAWQAAPFDQDAGSALQAT
ncbi:MAG: hypothetical protein QOJ52_273, partial [Acidimicrobiaceae bacterium]|nr:hypothetical protein [Acidimicrobiaceae bacterium]